MFKKHMFFNIIFSDFFFVLASESEGKMSNFRTLIENANFAKIIVFPKETLLFFWFGGSKKNPPKLDAQKQ